MNDGSTHIPEELVPMEDAQVALGARRLINVHRYSAGFPLCPEKLAIGLDRAYSAKPLVLVEKQATFPEIAVLSLFRRTGWEGAWVDAAHRKYFDKMPNQSKGASLGSFTNQLVARIAENNDKSRNGCWDLVLWADRAVAFVAVLGTPIGETIGEARSRWLAAALRSGLSESQFVIVEWDYRKVVVVRRRRRAAGDG